MSGGVVPPDSRSSQSSIRSAPARAAIIALSRLKEATSSSGAAGEDMETSEFETDPNAATFP